ncbi:MAG: hypothetical protein ACR2MY_07200 [Candidatus Dormibacteria bacterium]
MADRIVFVDPATVRAATAELRQASRQYSAAGWRISTSLPLMPPIFLVRTQRTLSRVAATLQLLAVEMEVDATVEDLRMARFAEADASRIGDPLRRFVGDLGTEVGEAWKELDQEGGPESLIDPVGGNAHVLMGAADTLSQLFHTAATLGRLDPLNGSIDPVGTARARQETLAMAVNLLLLLPEMGIIDPEGHRDATEQTVSRLVDWPDLQRGDVPRWMGHMGVGLVIAALTDGIGAGAEATAADAAAVDGTEGAAGVVNSGYKGLSQANRVPTDGPDARPGRRRGVVTEVENKVLAFLEPRPPARTAQP